MRTKLSLCLLASSIFVAGLQAAPLNIVESIDYPGGDFPGSGGPTYNLDIGINTVSGSVYGLSFLYDYADNFTLALPTGMKITYVFLFATTSLPEGDTVHLACFTDAGCYLFGLGAQLPVFTGSKSYTATPPYAINDDLSGELGFQDYKLSVTVVSDAPEPGTALLCLPLAVILLRRRTRSSR